MRRVYDLAAWGLSYSPEIRGPGLYLQVRKYFRENSARPDSEHTWKLA